MRHPLTRSGRIVVAVLVALSFVHWDCKSLYNPPPALIGVTFDSDPVQVDQNGNVPGAITGCGTIPNGSSTNKTLPYTWDFKYNNQTEDHVPILWPKGGIGTSPHPILLWDDPQNQTIPFNAWQTAAQSWQNALTTFATGSLLVSLQISANTLDQNNANIQAYDSSTANLREDQGGVLPGYQVYTQIASDWSTLVQSEMVMDYSLDQGSAWETALHEIGHSLGLRHSIYEASVMYPKGSPCMSYASYGFDYADLAWLENTYDPRWVTPKALGSPKPCTRQPCPQLRTITPSQSLVISGAHMLPHPYIIRRGQRSGGAFPPYGRLVRSMQRPSGIPNHPNAHWIMAEDNGDASTLSADSLWLASSLVAQVRVVSMVGSIVKGPLETVYETARVERVFKNQYGPDSGVQPGDVILLADNRESNGDEFVDDQLFGPQDGSALVFVRDVGGRYSVGGKLMPIHGFTGQFVSKYAIRPDSTVAALSVRNTLLYQDYQGRSLASILEQATRGVAAVKRLPASYAARYNSGSITSSLLSRNGITGPQAIAAYTDSLTRHPFAYYRQRAVRDAQLNHGRIPVTRPYLFPRQ